MFFRSLVLLTGLGFALALGAPASAQDAAICFGTADRVTEGAAITEEEKRAGHEACQRALAETASVVQNTICKKPISTSLGARRSRRIDAAQSTRPLQLTTRARRSVAQQWRRCRRG